jgi:hypothetical protein
MRSGSTASRSIGEFSLSNTGKYELSVTGPATTPLVFSFGKNWLLKFLGSFFGFALLGFGSAIAGGLIGLVVFVKRNI